MSAVISSISPTFVRPVPHRPIRRWKEKNNKDFIKRLLKDSITMLLRNGLDCESEFCVEALIGVTMDHNDVLLFNINETVKLNADGTTREAPAGNASVVTAVPSPAPSSPAPAPRRRRPHITPSPPIQCTQFAAPYKPVTLPAKMVVTTKSAAATSTVTLTSQTGEVKAESPVASAKDSQDKDQPARKSQRVQTLAGDILSIPPNRYLNIAPKPPAPRPLQPPPESPRLAVPVGHTPPKPVAQSLPTFSNVMVGPQMQYMPLQNMGGLLQGQTMMVSPTGSLIPLPGNVNLQQQGFTVLQPQGSIATAGTISNNIVTTSQQNPVTYLTSQAGNKAPHPQQSPQDEGNNGAKTKTVVMSPSRRGRGGRKRTMLMIVPPVNGPPQAIRPKPALGLSTRRRGRGRGRPRKHPSVEHRDHSQFGIHGASIPGSFINIDPESSDMSHVIIKNEPDALLNWDSHTHDTSDPEDSYMEPSLDLIKSEVPGYDMDEDEDLEPPDLEPEMAIESPAFSSMDSDVEPDNDKNDPDYNP